MEITRTLTVNLPKEEIAEIIKEYLVKEGFDVSETDIEFKLKTFSVGYGRDERDVTEFAGCEVTCKLKTKRKDE